MDTIGEYGTFMAALEEAEEFLDGAGKIDPERKAVETKRIISAADKRLAVVGINALRPAHEGIETISRILGRGGEVKFITMDPSQKTFGEREKFEDTALGRLRLEWNAAVSDLADAHKRAGEMGMMSLYLHDKWPLLSLVASDYNHKGEMQVNLYPLREGQRGLKGKTYQLARSDTSVERKAFDAGVGFLYALKDVSDGIGPQEFVDRLAESHRAWLKKYAADR